MENYQELADNILLLDVKGNIGYTFDVDIVIPDNIHDIIDDFPFAPDHMKVDVTMLTDYQKETWSHLRNNKKFTSSDKLLLTHNSKLHYVIHFALLQFFIQHGAIILKCHATIQFNQRPIFRDYISFYSRQRSLATDDFVKDYYKLKNNSLYGKLVENIRKHTNFRLCNTKTTCQSVVRFSDELVGVS